MKFLVASIILSLAAPVAAQTGYGVRRGPSPVPRSRVPEPSVPASRTRWDESYVDRKAEWDRRLSACLNDRHQDRHERRQCANMGFPVKARR
ncbi:MAG: hypothetical protein JF608_12185 [Sphingomonadales bacterium]|jgi:hypothetical protein|nr:hypothetical protein [Sphingomonadales bacterium]